MQHTGRWLQTMALAGMLAFTSSALTPAFADDSNNAPTPAPAASGAPGAGGDHHDWQGGKGHGWGHHRGGWGRHRRGHHHHHHDPLMTLQHRVNLTPDQLARLQPIVDAHKAQMKQQFEAGRQQFLAILTPEQRARMDQMKTARETAMKNHDWKAMHEQRDGFRSLNVTDAQKAQLKSMRENAFKQMKAQHEQFEQQFMATADSVLTPEQKETLLKQSIFGSHHGRHGSGRHHHGDKKDGDKKPGAADTHTNDAAPTE